MARLSVTVSIDKLGPPDYSSTAKTLDAFELVQFQVGQGGSRIAPTFEQVGECTYVKDCAIDVPIAVTYQVASDLKDNIDNAQSLREKNAHRQILSRIESHARLHYNRVVTNVIPAWTSDVTKDLDKALPTDQAPTSLAEKEIMDRVRPLVDYWIAELVDRARQDVYQWEVSDYPEIEKFISRLGGFAVLAVPRAPRRKAGSRPETVFPACQVKKGQAKHGDAK
jgi:hypothetical protein